MGSAEVEETFESYGTDVGDESDFLTRLNEWVLVEGDRQYVALGISVAVFTLLLVLNWVGLIAFTNDDSITRMSGGMIAGTFSLVTLVVSINQLILSREFRSAGEVQQRVEEVMEFHENIEDATEVPATPAEPTKLFELLVMAIHERAGRLPETVEDHPDEEFRALVEEYTENVQESAERIDDTLEATEFGTFQALSAVINYNDAWQLYAARHLKNRHADAANEETLAAFDDVIDALQRFNVAREHFKTTYLQRELTRFSQLTVYYGVPSVISAMLVGLFYADLTGATLDLAIMPYVTSALITVVVIPLALLAAYILRTATITRRTASVGPVLPQKDPEEGPFDVEYGDQE